MSYHDRLKDEIERLASALARLISKITGLGSGLKAQDLPKLNAAFQEVFDKSMPEIIDAIESGKIDEISSDRLSQQNKESLAIALVQCAEQLDDSLSALRKKSAQASMELIKQINESESTLSYYRMDLEARARKLLVTNRTD